MMFLLSLCIHIQRNSTARIQYLKKKERKRIVYVCTKDVSEIRENEQYGIFKRKKKRISKLAFPSRVKINEIKSLFGFFFTYIYINKKKKEGGEDFQWFFSYTRR